MLEAVVAVALAPDAELAPHTAMASAASVAAAAVRPPARLLRAARIQCLLIYSISLLIDM
jgi:hypothetical protein